MKFERIWEELNLKWNETQYLVIDAKTNKATVTSLRGLITIASKKCLDQEYNESLDPDIIEHEIKNELESIGIYVQHLKLSEKIDYEDIWFCKSLGDFMGD